MTKCRTAAFAIGLISLVPTTADACGVSPNFALIHSAVPKDLPTELIVAKVVIESDNQEALYEDGLRVTVIQMTQGTYLERRMILRASTSSSCDALFVNGKAGFIIGSAQGWSDGLLVVEPILVPRSGDFRLPDHFRLNSTVL